MILNIISIKMDTRESMNNRFRKGRGCFYCEECGKLTRDVGNGVPYCQSCVNKMEQENLEENEEV